jgi:hypothetical protein
MLKWIKRGLIGLVVFLVVIQVVRPSRTNPPIDPSKEISAKMTVDPAVQSILDRSCSDCHSNKTVWPWYSNVAPISWLVWRDVNDGRRHMNLSDFATEPVQREGRVLNGMCEETKRGDMPMSIYVPMHPQSKLTSADVDTICRWTDSQLQRLPPEARQPMRGRPPANPAN